MRLYQTAGSSTTRMLYDGQSLVAEYDGSSSLLRRYVHGPGTDEPLVWYEGTGTSTRRFYHADERGSIVATSDSSGAIVAVNSYDEYGIPASSNTGRFQYTGQQWLSEIGMYHYRARIYSPTLGRFLQTDPIGFGGGMNLYAYVSNNPVNFIDPAGLYMVCRLVDDTHGNAKEVTVASHVECYDNGQQISPIDRDVVDWVRHHLNTPEESGFSVFPDHIIPIQPVAMTECTNSHDPTTVTVTYELPALQGFQGGKPGHIHPVGFNPSLGPDDGLAASQAGTAYVGGTAGTYRVDRIAPNNFSVSLLSGNFGKSISGVISLITHWNAHNGQQDAIPQSQGGSLGHGARCHRTEF